MKFIFRSLILIVVLLVPLAQARCDDAVYSLDCWLNGDQLRERMGLAKYVRSMPDVFVVVDIEGKGRFLPAFIEREYKGQEMLITFKAPKPAFGEKITVNFYRDRSVSDHIWNQILQTRLDGGIRAVYGIEVAIEVGAEWHIQLAKEHLALSPPELLAQAVLRNPDTMSFKLFDEKTKITHGEVKLSIK